MLQHLQRASNVRIRELAHRRRFQCDGQTQVAADHALRQFAGFFREIDCPQCADQDAQHIVGKEINQEQVFRDVAGQHQTAALIGILRSCTNTDADANTAVPNLSAELVENFSNDGARGFRKGFTEGLQCIKQRAL